MNKTEFLNALTENGYKAVFANNGIPTVVVSDAMSIADTIGPLRALCKEKGYDQSCGIALETRV